MKRATAGVSCVAALLATEIVTVPAAATADQILVAQLTPGASIPVRSDTPAEGVVTGETTLAPSPAPSRSLHRRKPKAERTPGVKPGKINEDATLRDRSGAVPTDGDLKKEIPPSTR
jgi:hypothetical protein